MSRLTRMSFIRGLHGASQSGRREFALAPNQDLARKLWRAVRLLARLWKKNSALSTGIPVSRVSTDWTGCHVNFRSHKP